MPELFAESFTTEEGVTFEPMSTDYGIGYKVIDEKGRIEYVFLAPSLGHQINPDNDATADTFVYVVDSEGAESWAAENAGPGTGASLADYGEPVVYVNHFEGTAEREDDDE